VTFNDRLDPTERFVTIVRELGHIFLGHLGECASAKSDDDESGWPNRAWLGKNEKEVEAEAVAHLVASRAAVMTASPQYLKEYARRADMKKIDLELVVRAAPRNRTLGQNSLWIHGVPPAQLAASSCFEKKEVRVRWLSRNASKVETQVTGLLRPAAPSRAIPQRGIN
jgi:hypothetical protein